MLRPVTFISLTGSFLFKCTSKTQLQLVLISINLSYYDSLGVLISLFQYFLACN